MSLPGPKAAFSAIFWPVRAVQYLRSQTTDLKEFVALRAPFGNRLRLLVPRPILEAPVLFIHVPKNAGTSMYEALYGRSWPPFTAALYKRVLGDEYDRRETVAILRDPIDRFISTYFFVVNRGAARVKLGAYWRSATSHVKSVDDYLDFLEKHRDHIHRLDFIMRTQAHYVLDEAGRPIVKRLFLLGRDDAKIREYVLSVSGRDLRWLNAGLRETVEVTPRQRERILDLYRVDAELVRQLS